MGLNDRWRRQADEDHGTITTRIAADVDVKIRLPIVKGPNVSSLVDHNIR